MGYANAGQVFQKLQEIALAVKIVRQPKKIALIGACSSAAAFLAGTEKAPAALRAAGLVEKLRAAGFEVSDLGDCPPRMFADDEEHRRARNLPAIVAGLNDLKLHGDLAGGSCGWNGVPGHTGRTHFCFKRPRRALGAARKSRRAAGRRGTANRSRCA